MNIPFRTAFFLCLAVLLFALPGFSAQAQLTIMPLGDSGTLGDDYYTDTAGGYRDPLYHDLVASGISFTFVGANTLNATPTLTAANQTANNGYGFYTIGDIQENLNGNVQPNPGDGNQGGYWLHGGTNSINPDIILLEIGANDIIYQVDPQTSNPSPTQFVADLDTRLNTLITTIHSFSASSIILVAAIYPFNNAAADDAEIQSYDSYIKNTLVPSYSYTRYVDNYSSFLNADGTVNGLLLGTDNVHPTRYGYPIWAENWAAALRLLEGKNPTTYALTVNNGTGSGSYPAGSVITINSNAPPSGNQFQSWSAAVTALDNPYWPIATYTIPAAPATVTATYAATGSPAIPNGTYNIAGGAFQFSWYSGLSVAATSTTNGAVAVQQTYTGAANQQWVLTNLGNNVVELALSGTSYALTVAGASTAAGATIDIEPYTGATDQQWTITQILGTTEIVNVNSGMAINVNGYSTAPGGLLLQYYAGYEANQLWAFYPTTLTSPSTTTAVSDTPVLPPVGYVILCLALFGFAARFLIHPRQLD